MNKKQIFGSRIKVIRTHKGMSQRELADAIGRSTESISQLERGVYFPSFETLERLTSKLEVEMSELFDFSDDNASPKKVRLCSELIQVSKQLDIEKLEIAVNQIKALAGVVQ